jgi:glycosyltransferase involved in cell wall biosynthesis
MKVAMITEGTYPFVHGGVSTWCDRLIRQLPDIEFEIYAIAPSFGAAPVWDLPANVTSIHPIDLWMPRDRGFDGYPLAVRDRFLEGWETMLDGVLDDDGPNTATFLAGLRSLQQSGHHVPIDVGVSSAEAYEILRRRWLRRKAGDRIDRLGSPTMFDVLEATSALARYLMPLHWAPHADVAHTTANGLSSLTAFAAGWEHGTPCLLTEHGIYIRERFIEAFKSKLPPRVKALNLLFFRALNDATIAMSSLIAPVSDYNARWERETGALDENIMTIYNGVDPDGFPPITDEPDVPTVSWVGRVDPLKDLENLIDAFALVRASIPDARLRLFGPVPAGNEEYHAGLVSQIRNHGLDDAVTFEGLISPVRGAFVAGHVVALSSISEGFPFTVIEAMMSRRATVSTDVGGVAEVVGDAGALVPPRNPSAMAEALIDLLTDAEARDTMAAAARARALQHLTLDLMASRYRTAYRRTVDVVHDPSPRIHSIAGGSQ